MPTKAYYAVKKGYKSGIYHTWNECKEQVNGYPGAIYKKFTNLKDAIVFMSGMEEKIITDKLLNNQHNISKKNIEEKIEKNIDKQLKKSTTKTKNITPLNLNFTNNLDDLTIYHPHYWGIKNNNYYIFTDGSSQKSHSAYGIYFGSDNALQFSKILNGVNKEERTNNMAELMAILTALKIINANINKLKTKKIIIISDSAYSIRAITQWAKKWKRNNWKTSTGSPVKNKNIIEQILNEYENTKVLITFNHQYSHQKEPLNKESMNYYLWYGNNAVDYLVQKAVINK